jgi:hypothetical protein
MFVLTGPNAGTASIPVGADAQARYITSAIKTMRRRGIETVEVRPDVEASWMHYKDFKLRRSVWSLGGCKSYYVNNEGSNVSAWPGTMSHMVRELRTFDIDKYIVTPSIRNSQPEPSGDALLSELA